jgi:hypothetical protein
MTIFGVIDAEILNSSLLTAETSMLTAGSTVTIKLSPPAKFDVGDWSCGDCKRCSLIVRMPPVPNVMPNVNGPIKLALASDCTFPVAFSFHAMVIGTDSWIVIGTGPAIISIGSTFTPPNVFELSVSAATFKFTLEAAASSDTPSIIVCPYTTS